MEPDEEDPVAIAQLDPARHLAPQHDQLLPQRRILGLKSSPGLEQRRDDGEEQSKQRGHHARRKRDSAVSQPDGILGTHNPRITTTNILALLPLQFFDLTRWPKRSTLAWALARPPMKALAPASASAAVVTWRRWICMDFPPVRGRSRPALSGGRLAPPPRPAARPDAPGQAARSGLTSCESSEIESRIRRRSPNSIASDTRPRKSPTSSRSSRTWRATPAGSPQIEKVLSA